MLLDLNMASSVKAIIFDFDGTLYDFTLIPIRLILREPYHMFRIRADRVIRKQLRGMDFGTTKEFEAEYNKRMSKLTHLAGEENFKWYQTYVEKTMTKVLEKSYKIRDGLKDFIMKLKKKGISMGVLSDYSFVEKRMLAVGMDQELMSLFTKIYSAQEFGCLKPAKRAFLEIASALSVAPEECLVIGDRDDTDGEGARNCGMKFIQITDKKPKKGVQAVSWEQFTQWAEKEFEL